MAELGEQLGWWSIVPFVFMLLAIAVLPLVAGKWFHRNRNKGIIAVVLGVPTVVFLLAGFGEPALHAVGEMAEDYVAFIILLGTLYIISGGIYLTGNVRCTPWVNLRFLAAGAVLANLIGTMGASMILIRPLLRANSERKHSMHTVVFFIFAVGNIGGMLTPMGDPPLLLGFLRGVPFGWTLRLWPQWLLSLALLLALYFVLERWYYRREPAETARCDLQDYVPMRLKGGLNIVLLVLVIATMLLSDMLDSAGESFSFPFLPQLIMVVLAVASLTLVPHGPRAANSFTWGPIVEVAVIFAGIFATMIPALALLEAHGKDIGVASPLQYFWATGWLSAFLDNAPTYLAFTSIAQGQAGVSTIGELISTQPIPGTGFSPAQILAAISVGAVMMGALTYIGNAPNFAVRSIAESAEVKMPSFFGFMKYSLAFLLPILVIVSVVFFL